MKKSMKSAQSTGNNLVLMLVDKNNKKNYALVQEVFLPALNHYGMPYAVYDLSSNDILNDMLADANCVVIPQQDLCNSLSEEACDQIMKAVRAGAGLVNFDCFLQDTLFAEKLSELFRGPS